ncbi:MAG: GNAT family N-acetyltransferase, partial [Roseiflexaceae bacterium]|nr:GNAT family N-acetyltransferase [Roseiflexaceae bacterium]
DAFAIACADGRYVGQSQLLLMPETTELETGWTAVLPAYRQRGLATALKVATLVWAKGQGAYTAVRTWNNATNAKMIGINQRLGFVPQPEWFWFERTLEL